MSPTAAGSPDSSRILQDPKIEFSSVAALLNRLNLAILNPGEQGSSSDENQADRGDQLQHNAVAHNSYSSNQVVMFHVYVIYWDIQIVQGAFHLIHHFGNGTNEVMTTSPVDRNVALQ